MTVREGTIESIERVLKLTYKGNITVTIPRLAAERAVSLLKEQEDRDESLEKAREEIKWLRGMMKEQEAVKPECQIIFDVPYYFCGNCKTMLNMYAVKAKYCSNCGQAVKWK